MGLIEYLQSGLGIIGFEVLTAVVKPPVFTLVCCCAYSTLKMEEIYSSETSVDFRGTRRRYIP
jgi:hypothetical protein